VSVLKTRNVIGGYILGIPGTLPNLTDVFL